MVSTSIFLLVAGAVIAVGAAAVAIAELALGTPRSALEVRRRADLRRRAPFEKRAARQLREGLLQDLARQRSVRRDLEGDRAGGSGQAALLRDIERAEQATRNELAQIEMWLGTDG
jgi:hypothetical protein